MADQVEEVKAKTDIVSIIGEKIELKKAGRNYKALCPFHSEKTPSFMVSQELQIFKCFGCGISGDVISFLEEYEGMDFYEALKYLAERSGIKLRPRIGFESDKEKYYRINVLASRFYNYILLNHRVGRGALGYLTQERGLRADTLKTFQIGYSPDKPLAFAKFLMDKNKISSHELEKVGLIYSKDKRVFDRFRGRVIFPLFDHRGNVVGFAGRILPSDENKGLAKYINTPETEIYHKSKILYGLNLAKSAIKRKKQAVVVEGELDMISCWQAGIKNTVAIKGSAFTSEQVKLLGRYVKKIALALDADISGNLASRRGIELAEKEGFEIEVVNLGEFKDPDEMVRKDPKALKYAIKNTQGVWDFIIDSIFKNYKKITGREKAEISKEIIPILSSISDKIVQAHYIEAVARRLKVPVEAVLAQLSIVKKEGKIVKPLEEIVSENVKKGRRELLEERLLAIIFKYEPEILSDRKIVSQIKTPLGRRIVEIYNEIYKDKEFVPSEFAGNLPPELVEGFQDLILRDIQGLGERSPTQYQEEIRLLKHEIRTFEIKEKLNKAAQKIREFEKQKQKEKLQKEKERFGKLTKMLNKLEERSYKGIIL